MKFLSVCSGIEAASCAWNPLGWEAGAFAEIEPFPCAVLAHHYPTVPNLGDMTRFKEWPDAAFDLLCGGTPCQSFSVAGLRKGLDDPRGNLMLTFGAIAGRYRPRWLVWENVAGVLSSNGGRDFGAFLGLLGILGYGFAYRLFDAQYFGVAQRRRRVFVVGYFGDWRPAAAVLFERHSLQGHPAPRRETREGLAACPTLRAGGNRTGGDRPPGTDVDTADSLIAMELAPAGRAQANASHRLDSDAYVSMPATAGTLEANHGNTKAQHAWTGRLLPFDTTQVTSKANRSNPKPGDPCHPLAKGQHAPAIAFHGTQDPDVSGDVTHPMGRNYGHEQAAYTPAGVRRLTPRECERLQGFPDDYTAIPYRGKPAADGPRYKALGNSWAVPNARWIGERIGVVASILETAQPSVSGLPANRPDPTVTSQLPPTPERTP